MNNHLVIKAEGTPLTLPKDFSIDIDFQNPMFNTTEMFSYPVEIPIEGNRSVMKNIDDIHSSLRPVSMEHMDMRIYADGMPIASGTAVTSEGEEIDESVSMSVEPDTRSFEDIIGDLDCRDIVIPEKYKTSLLIGEKIGNVKCGMQVNVSVEVKYNTGDKEKEKTKHYTSMQGMPLENDFEPQALGFSYPGKCVEQGQDHSHKETKRTGETENPDFNPYWGVDNDPDSDGYNPMYIPVYSEVDVIDQYKEEAVRKGVRNYRNNNSVIEPRVAQSYINVSAAYGESMNMEKDVEGQGGTRPAYYANARVCYKHYKLDEDGKTSSELEDEDPGNERENRDKYWVLDADRPQSGICFYVMFFLDCLFEHLGVTFDKSALTAIGDFNRLCFYTTHCKYDTEVLKGTVYKATDAEVVSGEHKAGDIKNYYFDDIDRINAWLSSRGCGGRLAWENPEKKNIDSLEYSDKSGNTVQVVVGQSNNGAIVESITCTPVVVPGSKYIKANVLAMYANSENFPDTSVKTILDSLENSFGIKFSYDYEQKKVTAYLMRNIFRSTEAPIDWRGQIHSMTKASEKITGVRMCYSDESDLKEQRNNIKNKVKDYDTRYDYIEYPEDRTVTDKDYEQIRSKLSNTDMKVYVDMNTGNVYRIKIDADYTDAQSMHPVLFEVADMKGVEYGDCSTENEEFIKEFSSDFQPVPMNDVNYHRERAAITGDNTRLSWTDPDNGKIYYISNINSTSRNTMMAAYIDEDMEHEFVEHKIRNNVSCSVADAYMTEYLTLVESYDPTGSDDGNSPLQSYDWGNAIAIMRGGGTDATVTNYDANYDGCGNMKWKTVAGQYAMTVDSIDPFGSEYDYNGTMAGLGDEERFSLKIRAFKQPEWATEPLCNPDIMKKDTEGNPTDIVETKIRSRGLFDTFMIEYAHFLVNRKKYIIRTESTVAEISNVRNNWQRWFRFNGIKGLINKISTSVNMQTGLNECEIEFYAL